MYIKDNGSKLEGTRNAKLFVNLKTLMHFKKVGTGKSWKNQIFGAVRCGKIRSLSSRKRKKNKKKKWKQSQVSIFVGVGRETEEGI